MPRSTKQLMEYDYEAASRVFDALEPTDEDRRVVGLYIGLQEAAEGRAVAERAILEAVRAGRMQGFSWKVIGLALGTSGEAARQRYGALASS